MLRRPVKAAAVVLGLIVLAGAGYTAFWYSAADGVRTGIQRWEQDRRARGWTIALGEPDIGGFPFRIDIRLRTPRLAGPQQQWRWALPDVRASARPWAPGEISVSAPGLHSLIVKDDEISVRLARADGDLSVNSDGFRRTVIRFGGLELDQGRGVTLRAETLTLRAEAQVPVSKDAETAERGFGLAFDARTVSLPSAWRPPMGTGLSRLSFDAVITGDIEPRGKLPDALARWRDKGGAIEVKALAVDWQALSLRADGTFALDEALQPQGAMTAEINGIDKTADALVAAGVIDAKTAFAARVTNRALSFGRGGAKLPLSIQKSRLYLGPVPLLRLKPVRW